jgi:hypothetical protein
MKSHKPVATILKRVASPQVLCVYMLCLHVIFGLFQHLHNMYIHIYICVFYLFSEKKIPSSSPRIDIYIYMYFYVCMYVFVCICAMTIMNEIITYVFFLIYKIGFVEKQR